MTRYKLARFTTTGSQMTVKTTNPAEVERWLWDAMSAQDTKSVTITREHVDPPKPKDRPQCEGQLSIVDRLATLPDQEEADRLALMQEDRRELILNALEWCSVCGWSQCPKVGARPANCRLGR